MPTVARGKTRSQEWGLAQLRNATRTTGSLKSVFLEREVILIVTDRSDQTADWLILELERRGTPFLRFNTEDYPVTARLIWGND